jgi:hypothetical protein
MNPLPTGWGCSKSLTLFAGSGAGTNYQIIIKAYFGNGTDGTENLNGETIAKFYCKSKCRTDFADIRFLPNNTTTPYTYKLCNKVDGEWAVFAVKISDDLDSNQTIRAIYNNPSAINESSDEAFEAVIFGVVGAWPLNELDQEVNSITIDLSEFTSSTNGDNSSVYGISYNAETGEFTIDNSNNDSSICIWKRYSLNPLNLSTKQLVRIKIFGANTNQTIGIAFSSQDENSPYYNFINSVRYNFADNFAGERTIIFDKMAPDVSVGTIDWTSIYRIRLSCNPTNTGTIILSSVKFDEGVPAVDYSGNSNHGIATGTTISDSKFTNIKARNFNGSDVITTAAFSYPYVDKVTLAFFAKPSVLTHVGSVLSKSDFASISYKNTSGDVYFGVYADDNYWTNYLNSAQLTANNWHFVIFEYDNISKTMSMYIDNILRKSFTLTELSSYDLSTQSTTLNIGYSDKYGYATNYKGLLSQIYLIHNTLTSTQKTSLNSNYPDASLIEGSICLRKWANTTPPTFGEWSTEENIISDTITMSDAALIFKTIKPCDVINLYELTIRDKLLAITELLTTFDDTITSTRLIQALDTMGIDDIAQVQKILIIKDQIITQDNAAKVKNTRIFLLIGDLAIQISNQ